MINQYVFIKKSDMEALLKDGMDLGLAKNYIKDNDGRVVVASNVM